VQVIDAVTDPIRKCISVVMGADPEIVVVPGDAVQLPAQGAQTPTRAPDAPDSVIAPVTASFSSFATLVESAPSTCLGS
jgi:hypothetical protein